MKIRLLGLVAVLGVAAGWIAACETEQPPGGCPVSHLSNFAILDPKPGQEGLACADLTGELISFSKYNTPGTTTNTLGLAVESVVGDFFDDPRRDADDVLSATGSFDFTPTDGFCVAADLSSITVNVPAAAPDPAANLSYKFTNLRMAALPNVPGTQWTADLAYTADGCTAQYDVVGVSPRVPCAEGLPDGGATPPDDSRCNATTLPGGRTVPACNEDGECIHPDLAMICDPKIRDCDGEPCRVCRPNGAVPSVRSN
jgi:hypothetical protein